MKRITSFSDCEHIEEYANIVKTEAVPVCDEQKKLVALVENAFETEELYFDPEQVEKYFSYQKYFPFDLFPWERFCFVLHNCIFTKDYLPRWQDLLIMMGRGGGKNGYLSFEDFCLITETNGIQQYHIDICANTGEQAKTSFDEIYDVLEQPQFSKVFSRNFKWNMVEIKNLKTGSKIKYRTNNARSKDGLRSGKVDFDEIHAYLDWENLNVFTTGLGKKPHPRMTYATTDGDVRDGPLDQLKERSAQILNGELADNGLLPFICKLDHESEVKDEDMWVKANPSLPYRPELMQRIRTEYQNFILDPIKNSSFMTKRMNIPQGRKDIEVTSWDNIKSTDRPLPDLTGRACVGGIDFTKTTDFLGASLVFRDGDDLCAINHSWFCTNSKDKHRIKAPLKEWEERGLLTMVDDVEISPELVAAWFSEMRTAYNIEKIGIDLYRFATLRKALEAVGFTKDEIKLVRPSDIMLVQNRIDSLFNRHRIAWGDNPLMRWFTNNTKLEPAPNNNFKYGKIEPFSRKTDGFMAFVHAMTVEDSLPEDSALQFMKPITF